MSTNDNRGTFIVIEGPDGTGKTVQTELLEKRLKQLGFTVQSISFPRYQTPTGKKVQEYLDGKRGNLDAKEASMLYAEDRRRAANELENWLSQGDIVVANRYVGSNMGHQGAKFETKEERDAFFKWNDELEFIVNGIPRPDINIVLDIPFEVAQKRIDERSERTGVKKDAHEADPDHLKRAHSVYKEIVHKFPSLFISVSGMDGTRELSAEEISEKIWDIVHPRL